MADSPHRVACVFGIRGTGKTTLIRTLTRSDARILAHDPFGEHSAVLVDSVQDAAEFLDRSSTSRYRVSIQGFQDAEEQNRLCALAWILGKRAPLTVVLEEADQIAPPMREPLWLKRIIAQGRHVGLSLVAVSRRPAEVSRLLTSQADLIYCFRTHEPRDIAYLRQVMGNEALRITELSGHDYLTWDSRTGSHAPAPDPDQEQDEQEDTDEETEETDPEK